MSGTAHPPYRVVIAETCTNTARCCLFGLMNVRISTNDVDKLYVITKPIDVYETVQTKFPKIKLP